MRTRIEYVKQKLHVNWRKYACFFVFVSIS